jgi:hypothetical protein
MTTLDQAVVVAGTRVAEAAPGRRPILSYNWWR